MEKSQSASSYQRLQELLAVPERQRTEAQWAEINELEITLTPVNRANAPEQNHRRKPGAPTDQPKPREGAPGKWGLKKLRKRPPRGGTP
ncbi:hypothetical protein [Nitrosovibrio tenuis]|uniref:Uncharacterized protein n=1 Tax=Nitrosovibrio tenuis TaxID=1233 RepID=A0A1H7HBL4_9PROT|nr:hypothetical protein [Nitrosovibrio tenuis]SEK45535.1 hypothetical protein SAMN05216387_101476 [Nitrosovibrio tenuis]